MARLSRAPITAQPRRARSAWVRGRRPRRLRRAVGLATLGAPASAAWLHKALENGGTGSAETPSSLTTACAAHAPDTSPDIVLAAAATGYRTPALQLDPATGRREVAPSAADALFAASVAEGASALQAKGAAYASEARGAGSVRSTFASTCRQRLGHRRQPRSLPMHEWPHAQGAAPAELAKGCAASCAGAVRYLALAEIEGNGQRDAVLDVRGVTCRRTDPQPGAA